MIHSHKHFSEAKMMRWEKKFVSSEKSARIASKRFNKAERKAAKQSCRQQLGSSSTTPSTPMGPYHARYWNCR